MVQWTRRTDSRSTHWRIRRRTDNRSTHWRIRTTDRQLVNSLANSSTDRPTATTINNNSSTTRITINHNHNHDVRCHTCRSGMRFQRKPRRLRLPKLTTVTANSIFSTRFLPTVFVCNPIQQLQSGMSPPRNHSRRR